MEGSVSWKPKSATKCLAEHSRGEPRLVGDLQGHEAEYNRGFKKVNRSLLTRIISQLSYSSINKASEFPIVSRFVIPQTARNLFSAQPQNEEDEKPG